MKKIAILGSTGSIGTQTLEVVRENGDIEVLGLAAGSNISLLEEQIREFQPKLVAVWDEKKAAELKIKVQDLDVKIVTGMDGLIEVSVMEEVEILLTAVVGMIGIRPTVEAIKAGKDIALANKETLVTAGHIIMPLAKEMGVSILPVDSEHSAIFQSLQGNKMNSIHKILLTASVKPGNFPLQTLLPPLQPLHLIRNTLLPLSPFRQPLLPRLISRFLLFFLNAHIFFIVLRSHNSVQCM